ncbi:Ppx/GppA phosphatase family protein [Deinococcus cellulosilyticus]|uniref:Exopolyphosphatase n=1 Tax=Deinococcus cellulosilyticus (strain DSM 18568 / NBRC 106333 / KACC 11606 / 5516J-15) TaxID=1223518 RepID=A0A511NA43_DEIC1|nr:Ppx/GppA phosphatase family protein [Deinococcus cellulosilyticus]GEM49368.1 exopolyphosphatase [Deinococcus cellulosilyticus NBRC 106333 = KACC 11606]
MRVAIADVGTNSCHLLIGEFKTGQVSSYHIIESLKDRTRLGECLQNGRLTDEGYEKLKTALARFKVIAEVNEVSDFVVYATSATRDAENGPEIVKRLQDEIGVNMQIISGEKEGELTYMGAASSVEFSERNLLLDLGGGSLEIVLGNKHAARKVVSVPLGGVRLREMFLKKDPANPAVLARIEKHVTDTLTPHLAEFTLQPGTKVIGSSGSMESIAAILATRAGLASLGINGFNFRVSDLQALFEELRYKTLPERLKTPGLDPKRADIIVVSLLVILTTLRLLGATQVTVSTGALREGMMIEYLAREADYEAQLSPRQRSVLEVAERYRFDAAHAKHVTQIAKDLFMRLLEHVRFLPEARSMLRAAGMLHEIGTLVGQSSHHKHSQYLIRHSGLRGYEPWQVEVIGLVARYHRKSPPKSTHSEYQTLSKEQQLLVRQLSAILRVADGLDRAHTQNSSIHSLIKEGNTWVLYVTPGHIVNLWGAKEKSDLWNQVFGPLNILPWEDM